MSVSSGKGGGDGDCQGPERNPHPAVAAAAGSRASGSDIPAESPEESCEMTSVLATRSLDDFKNVSEDGWRYKPEGSYLPPVGASRKRSLSSLLQQKCKYTLISVKHVMTIR
ncbi:uncharacterized protein [Bemisia tabaci]|uniref:uncharacterized protein n=1 Tax=Bemisia tabaci TaxID=7038 RepID=UPI003B27BC5B